MHPNTFMRAEPLRHEIDGRLRERMRDEDAGLGPEELSLPLREDENQKVELLEASEKMMASG